MSYNSGPSIAEWQGFYAEAVADIRRAWHVTLQKARKPFMDSLGDGVGNFADLPENEQWKMVATWVRSRRTDA